jgi:hypothetical protein
LIFCGQVAIRVPMVGQFDTLRATFVVHLRLRMKRGQ